MAAFRVICTNQEPEGKGHDIAHIVALGTSDRPEETWSLEQVYSAMDTGVTFHTVSPSTGQQASVNKYKCKTCGKPTLRSSPDAVQDNNLDNIGPCS